MKKYKGYLLDLDGTLLRGDNKIEGVKEFLTYLDENNLPYLIFTNNATASPIDIVEKIDRIAGYRVNEENIFSSAMSTRMYLENDTNHKKVLLLGEGGIQNELVNANFELVKENADVVVCSLFRELTYQDLKNAAIEIQKGAEFIATNPDLKYPDSGYVIPGAGSISKLLENTTGVTPKYFGKPESLMYELAANKIGLGLDEVLMVGDNLDTDVKGAYDLGIDCAFMLTGVHTVEDLEPRGINPTYICENIMELKGE